ncbi:hypothetical protein THRCLA_20987 [Thraustotheca clavata]|uniref:Non-structural maintenance of chromosomes element 1 homolog n=1 Tax=Thraustotheca clavata TaxID=74557 RepID=A0A1W0A1K1_9STRA|nr:hypothetical protein THRCLA_20987 [Thraustotheca clavata]
MEGQKLAHGALSEEELLPMVMEVFGREITSHELGEITSNLALKLRPYSLDIKKAMYDNGKTYYGLINTVGKGSDDLTKLSNTYKPWEIVLFRKAIEQIVESEDGELDSRDFLNLREGNTIVEVRALLQRLYDEKWFAPSIFNDDQATLGPRVFLELVVFLRELGIHQCTICSSDVLQGVRCPTPSCITRTHESCLAKYERKGRKYNCSACRKSLR